MKFVIHGASVRRPAGVHVTKTERDVVVLIAVVVVGACAGVVTFATHRFRARRSARALNPGNEPCGQSFLSPYESEMIRLIGQQGVAEMRGICW